MDKNQKTHRPHYFFSFLIVVLIILVAGVVWVFSGPLSSAKANFLKIVPLPIALVDNKPVLIGDYLEVEAAASSLGYDNQKIYNALLANEQIIALANELNAMPAYFSEKKIPENFLQKAEAAKAALKLYYNSQEDINKQTYTLAKNLEQRINQGESFALLAQAYSQDDLSKNFGGEVAGMAYKNMLPEIEVKVTNMKIGQTKVIASTLGVHVLQLELKNSDSAKLKQIFLATTGYDTWLQNNLNKIKIKTIIRP